MSEQLNESAEETRETKVVEFGDHPISVRHRRRFVDTGDMTLLVSPRDIVGGSKSRERAFYRFCEETDIHSWCGVDEESESLLYPVFTRDIFQEELAWRAEWKKLPPLLAIDQISDHLGASPHWARQQLEQEGISPHTKRTQRYIKSSTMFLRGKKMETRDMPTSRTSLLELAALHELDEYDLEEWAIENEFKIDYHIADRVLVATVPTRQVNKLLSKLPRAEDWLSSELLSDGAEVPPEWVERQLDTYGMPNAERFDGNGRLLTHYPPVSREASQFVDIDKHQERFIDTVFDPTDTVALGSLFSVIAAERKKLIKIAALEDGEQHLDSTYRRISRARNEIIRIMSSYST